MTDAFEMEKIIKGSFLTTRWYHNNIINVLRMCKEKRVRDVDATIRLGNELIRVMDEPVPKPKEIPDRFVVPFEDISTMRPVEPEVRDILFKSHEKGAAEKYLNARYKKAPEEKFSLRMCSNWDYGWQQKQSHMLAREINAGKTAILRDTFYRKGNVAPDLPNVPQPSGGEWSICSQYSCTK